MKWESLSGGRKDYIWYNLIVKINLRWNKGPFIKEKSLKSLEDNMRLSLYIRGMEIFLYQDHQNIHLKKTGE